MSDKLQQRSMDDTDLLKLYYRNEVAVLPEDKEKKRQLIEQAYAMILSEEKRINVVKTMMKLHQITRGQAESILSLALNVFGDIFKTRATGMKAVLYEKYMDVWAKAMKQDNLDAAIKALAGAAKCIPEEEHLVRKDPPQLPPMMFVQTNNYAAADQDPR